MAADIPIFADIQAAHQRISPYVHRTPVLRCQTLDRIAGAELFFKCENFQKGGAFKFRGACNAVLSLENQQAARGVVTHSSGNHAGALALAARIRNIQAHIVMPENAPRVKQLAVSGYGGQITFCHPTQKGREETTHEIQQQTGAVLIHPYNDPRIIAGQGTAAVELLEEVPNLDAVLAPVGGGGLLSGTILAAKHLKADCQVIGAEPANANDAFRSWQQHQLLPVENPNTVADGLRTSLGSITFEIIHRQVDQIVTVEEEEIISAMRIVWERMKIIIEPSSAVPVAAVLASKLTLPGRKIGIILSGGNADLDNLPF